eukprot:1193114-Prorocentrum_minimum.AAC.4
MENARGSFLTKPLECKQGFGPDGNSSQAYFMGTILRGVCSAVGAQEERGPWTASGQGSS